MIKYVKGNLIRDAHLYDYIIHGCNCVNTMGAGIAYQVARFFPEAMQADMKTKRGDISKLGTYSKYDYDMFTVINAYTQYDMGFTEVNKTISETRIFRQNAISNVFKKIKNDFGNKNKSFAINLLGSDLAGGIWKNIIKLIEAEMKDEFVTVVIWENDKKNLKRFNL